jgi:hypothetical protein
MSECIFIERKKQKKKQKESGAQFCAWRSEKKEVKIKTERVCTL